MLCSIGYATICGIVFLVPYVTPLNAHPFSSRAETQHQPYPGYECDPKYPVAVITLKCSISEERSNATQTDSLLQMNVRSEVAGGVDGTVWIMVLLQVTPEPLRPSLFPVDAVITGVEEVILRQQLLLLPAP